MKTSFELAAIAAVTSLMLVAVAACGKKDDARASDGVSRTSTTSASVTARASCSMISELGTCDEYRGGSTFGVEKSLCEGFHGKFATGGCLAEGRIGSCVVSEGELKRYYGAKAAGDHALSADEAKRDCESEPVKGKFTPAPIGAQKDEVSGAPAKR